MQYHTYRRPGRPQPRPDLTPALTLAAILGVFGLSFLWLRPPGVPHRWAYLGFACLTVGAVVALVGVYRWSRR